MRLKKITSLPPLSDRAWLSAPHPTLPLLATCSSNKTVQISSLRTFTPLSTIEGGHKRSIRSVAWKPNTGPQDNPESVLATGSFDATAGIWRRHEGQHEEHIHSHDHDDEYGRYGEEEEEEEEWRFAVVLDGHESEVKSVAWSAGGSFLATCSRDKSVWVWEEMDDDNFETIAVLQEHTQDVKCVKWHPEEELLASSSYDDTIRLYKEDVDDWACCAVLTGHTSTVWDIDFEKPKPSHGSAFSRLVSCSDDLTVRIWTRTSSSDSSSFINKPPSILRTNSIEEQWTETACLPAAHTRTIYSVSWCSSQPGRIVSCGGDGKLAVYEEFEVEAHEHGEKKKEWRIVAEVGGAHGVCEVNNVCWAKRWDKGKRFEGEDLVISTGDDGVVSFWELALE
ncbi:WD40 repeat-like protein [Terfezia boudieri ATCC MYA-4762]|uniref:Probable cytosolic iron-sulfur protein assembly protein 1 n=1 Tax=Terfezia boudieri ATCC MYA-4762 TaxID=1051890 RepID=A0A3N4M0N4_9PEZI|nr:WD40 repeat-like protein [Terfezia boudieri ATCC MYA-4762]